MLQHLTQAAYFYSPGSTADSITLAWRGLGDVTSFTIYENGVQVGIGCLCEICLNLAFSKDDQRML